MPPRKKKTASKSKPETPAAQEKRIVVEAIQTGNMIMPITSLSSLIECPFSEKSREAVAKIQSGVKGIGGKGRAPTDG